MAADRVEDASLRKLFSEMARVRKGIIAGLSKWVSASGEHPSDAGTAVGTARRRYARAEACILADEQLALVEHLEGAEDETRGEFIKALGQSLPREVEEFVRSKLATIESTGEKIKALKEALQ
jgi:uncharacterized protein (TIGR02284 family)